MAVIIECDMCKEHIDPAKAVIVSLASDEYSMHRSRFELCHQCEIEVTRYIREASVEREHSPGKVVYSDAR